MVQGGTPQSTPCEERRSCRALYPKLRLEWLNVLGTNSSRFLEDCEQMLCTLGHEGKRSVEHCLGIPNELVGISSAKAPASSPERGDGGIIGSIPGAATEPQADVQRR
jgi:hypothetical protein